MIEVEHLRKDYGSNTAIQDVTFQVESGEILGFLGPNGAGKTTTMRILTGYLPATRGTVRVAGHDVHEESLAVRQRIGYLPETPPLYLNMSIEGFLHFVARLKGVSAGDRTPRVNSAMRRCGLFERRKTLIRKLSKGFRQRVGIAQAIVHDPPVIVLDEPTVGLDPRQIIEVRNLIKSLAGSHTIILSTHILQEVSMICNRITIINRGSVVATNTPENLISQFNLGTGYEVEFSGDLATVRDSIQSLSGVKSIKVIGNPDELGGRTRILVEADAIAELGRELSQRFVNAGLGLYELRRVQASLEDVFLKLTMTERSLTDGYSDNYPTPAPHPVNAADSSETDPDAADPEAAEGDLES